MKRFLNLLLTLALCLGVTTMVLGASTKSKIPVYNGVVAQDGTGQFTSVQAAINAVPDNNTQRFVIYIKKGIYKELVVVPKTKPFISLIGENGADTVITFNNGAGTPKNDGSGKNFGTSGSSTVFVQGDGFTANNITFENAFDETSEYALKGSQAVAIKNDADKLCFTNCRFLGNQDTLLVNSGRQYYKNCYVEGDVDFIFGAGTAVFDGCHIHSVYRGNSEAPGYLTAPSTQSATPYGFIFFNCKLTADPKIAAGSIYLGRPWHPSKNGQCPKGDPNVHAQSFFIHCEIGAHINADGWTSMSTGGNLWDPADELFREYKCSGPGANTVKPLRKQLTDAEVKSLTLENIFKEADNWNPTVPVY